MGNILVSVYIPTCNRSELLRKAVNSVLNQTYRNIEIIICDDNSKDNTSEVVNEIINSNPEVNIIYLKNDESKGACYSRNRCIKSSNGEYITGLDDDDEFSSDRVARFISYLEKTEYSFFCAGIIFKNSEYEKRGTENFGPITIDDLKEKNGIGNQVFAPKEYFNQLGGFDESFPSWQDYDMWFRMVHKYGDCLKIPFHTYIMNVDADRKRITTGSKSHMGFENFIDKHKKLLTIKNITTLEVRDKINRNQYVPLFKYLPKVSINTLMDIIKNNIRLKLGPMDKVISLIRRM